MGCRAFGRAGWQVSEIGFGAWAVGSAWGHVSEEDALGALRAAIKEGGISSTPPMCTATGAAEAGFIFYLRKA